MTPFVAQQHSLSVWWLKVHDERSREARDPPDAEMGTSHACTLHRIDRGLLGSVAVCFRAWPGMPDVGKRNLDAYTRHRSDNRHCYKEGPTPGLLSESLFDARLKRYYIRIKRTKTKEQANTKSGVYSSRANMCSDAVFVLALPPLLTRFITKYDTTLGCCDGRGMGPSTMWIRALQRKFAKSR